MSYGQRKEITQLIYKLEKQGFHVFTTKKNHYGVKKPGGKTVFMPYTPSDSRGIHRVIKKLKGIGYVP